ncbi:MAG: hypothetical protein DIZ80_00065 [endosymbiont of Galathealinum brachiosum]|uniref:Alkylmercury lyase n=1 Tax=endosymbiont of Galathealinum brachiosum TaxID=2200906 RepID=A0A370DLZ9_9GAMM|nr:MAG: hypothetical protein DIZ80_00065 [endosymbiont of Galathealinum brachiosum]
MSRFSTAREDKINIAVKRLNNILPLKQSQLSLSPLMNRLYQEILFSYIDIGRSLNRAEIISRVDSIEEVIELFKEKDLVVFDEIGEPIGAYPFTMESRVHQLSVNGYQLNSMCALDALAVSPMFNKPVEITSKCHVTDERVCVKQSAFNILNLDEVTDLCFGINWGSASGSCCCANSLCGEMVFLKGEDVCSGWLNEDLENREVFNLMDAIKFASLFFKPVIENEI